MGAKRGRTKRMTKNEMISIARELYPQPAGIRFYEVRFQNTLDFNVHNQNIRGVLYCGNLILKEDYNRNIIYLSSHGRKNRTTLKRINWGLSYNWPYYRVALENNLWYVFQRVSGAGRERQTIFIDGMSIPIGEDNDSLEYYKKHEYKQMKALMLVDSYCDSIAMRIKDGKTWSPSEARMELAEDMDYLNRVIENKSWSDTLLHLAFTSEGIRNTRESEYTYPPNTILLMRLRRFLKRFYNLPAH